MVECAVKRIDGNSLIESVCKHIIRLHDDTAHSPGRNASFAKVHAVRTTRAHAAENPDARIDAVVLLAFPANDFDDVAARVRNHLAKPRFELAAGRLVLTNVPVPRPDADAFDAPEAERFEFPSWLSHFQLWNTVVLRPRVRAVQRRIFEAREESAATSARESHKRALAQALIDGIDRGARARGADFAVMVIATDESDSRANAIAAWLAERGLAHRRFDLDAGWRRRTHCIDGHLSPAGNDQLARETLGLLAAR